MARAACLRSVARTPGSPHAGRYCHQHCQFHEQAQGALAYLKRARQPDQFVSAYVKLERIWRWFLKMNVVSYSVEAQGRFAELKPQCPRVKTMDLRIASIALVTDSTLLSRNLRDFRQVRGLVVE